MFILQKLAHRRQTVIRWPAASARSNSTELKKNSNEIVFVPNESERYCYGIHIVYVAGRTSHVHINVSYTLRQAG